MAVYFFDSSAIVKRYVAEPGTAWVVATCDPATGNDLYAARIAGVEVVAAIVRRTRRGDLSPAHMRQAVAQFRREFATGLYRLIEVTPTLIQRAMGLSETHGLRGYDAVQLAAALSANDVRLTMGLKALTLVSADGELNTAAQAEGLSVDNPNLHP